MRILPTVQQLIGGMSLLPARAGPRKIWGMEPGGVKICFSHFDKRTFAQFNRDPLARQFVVLFNFRHLKRGGLH